MTADREPYRFLINPGEGLARMIHGVLLRSHSYALSPAFQNLTTRQKWKARLMACQPTIT